MLVYRELVKSLALKHHKITRENLSSFCDFSPLRIFSLENWVSWKVEQEQIFLDPPSLKRKFSCLQTREPSPNFLSVCIISSISNPFKKAFNVISTPTFTSVKRATICYQTLMSLSELRNWLKKEMSDVWTNKMKTLMNFLSPLEPFEA